MKYEFNVKDDEVTLKYKDKEFKFKTTVSLISELQKIGAKAEKKMIMDCVSNGQSIKDLTVEVKKDGKTYYDNSNREALKEIYQNELTLEFFDEKCKEFFNMTMLELADDIGLETEEEGEKFTVDLVAYMSGKFPR